MKIIHTADIHLGSKMDSKFPKEISDVRKSELRATFQRMVTYAEQNGIKLILLAGDVFDSDSPFKKDKEFFYSVVRSHSQIDFLYLRGNHDCASAYEGEQLANLKLFGESWTSYVYDNVCITAIEQTRQNATSLYSTLALQPSLHNIVMLHGQIGDASGYGKIQLVKLREKNINYLALGHVHSFAQGKLDDRGIYAYSGCLEGRGFDETGEKGFVVYDTEAREKCLFVPFAERKITEQEVDITGLTDAYAVVQRIKEQVRFSKRDIYRVVLVGDVEGETDELAQDVQTYLKDSCCFLEVKDKSRRKIDSKAYEGDISLRGEFVRAVCANTQLSEEDKVKIISYGLKALDGRGIEE
jgi:DNA repair exonuclease SbcCD nuclease subunit